MKMENILMISLALILLVQGGQGAKVTDSYSPCNNTTVGECEADQEMLMPSETAKRFLAEEKKYISIGALSKNQPACSGGARGQAYGRNGDCLPPQANPYHRPCSKYYRCRSDS